MWGSVKSSRARYIKIEPSDLELLELSAQMITELEQAPDGAKAQLEIAWRYCDSHPAYIVSMSLQRLKARYWLVETMRTHLAQPDLPPNGTSSRVPIVPSHTSLSINNRITGNFPIH